MCVYINIHTLISLLINILSHRHKWSEMLDLAVTNRCLCLTVKVIMDKISKRSKGYAFVEYTTEEAAAAAQKEMNGKVNSSFSLFLAPTHK